MICSVLQNPSKYCVFRQFSYFHFLANRILKPELLLSKSAIKSKKDEKFVYFLVLFVWRRRRDLNPRFYRQTTSIYYYLEKLVSNLLAFLFVVALVVLGGAYAEDCPKECTDNCDRCRYFRSIRQCPDLTQSCI